MSKSSNTEIDQRVKEVEDLLLEGFQRRHILQHGSKWKVSSRQIDEYISRARLNIKEINDADTQDNLALINEGLWDTFRNAKKLGNVTEQRQILMAIAKLKGLDNHAVTHVIEDKRELADVSNEDLDKLLESGE